MSKKNPFLEMLHPLKGGVISDIIVDDKDPFDPYCGFIVTRPEAVYQVIALRDPEGNGAGFMEVIKIDDWKKRNK